MTYRHICQLGLLLSVLTQAPTVHADDDEMIFIGVLGAGLVVSVRQAIVDESFRSGWVATAVGSGLLVSYGFAATLGALDPEDDEHYAALTPATMRLLPWAPRGGSGTAAGSAGLLLAGSF